MSNELDMNFNIDFKNKDAIEFSQLNTEDTMSWLAPIKQVALDQFKSSKIPNRKIEHWKYNDLFFLQENTFNLDNADLGNNVLIENTSGIRFDSSIDLTFVNGSLISSIDEILSIDGLTITPFKQANEAQQKLIISQIDPQFNQKNILLNLNESLLENGLLIEVDNNKVIKTPIYLRYFNTSKNEPTISTNKLVVSVGQSSQLTMVEQFDTDSQPTEHLSLQQTTINLAANSQFNHYRLNLEFETAKQVSQVKTQLHKDSVLNSFYLGLGSQLNRTDIDVLHMGQNGEANIKGIYLPSNNQTIDYHTNIEHRVPQCTSNEVFRGIIADQSSATFNGKIHIFQDAQKSDAYLNNKNLLLTNQATINTKPELEIYADDVVCAHGATVAQLDKKSMYYMQTRGLSYRQAKKLLSVGFVQELLNQIPLEAVQNFLTELLEQFMSHVD
jgi:Fe-S cluster assembly protein SufD